MVRPGFVSVTDPAQGNSRPLLPARGWNSWMSFGFSLTEDELVEQADAMNEVLGDAGFDTIVIDAQWYVDEPRRPRLGDPDPGVSPNLDQFGLPFPSSRRFPSVDEFGFRNLARRLHARGQKLGIHLMRGVPRLAVVGKARVRGTEFTCLDIADQSSVCAWNLEMFGLIPEHPGSQAYYDSVFEQLREWEIDYVKYDDLGNPYSRWDIEAIRRSIERCGRRILFSVSPGPIEAHDAAHAAKYADSFRVSGDLWDDWSQVVRNAKDSLNLTKQLGEPGFPDLDMLPIGEIGMRAEVGDVRASRLGPHEIESMFALWSFLKSPLLLGGDLRSLERVTIQRLNSPFLRALHESRAPIKLHVLNDLLLLASTRLDRDEVWIAINLGETERDALDLLQLHVVRGANLAGLGSRSVQPHGHLFLSTSGTMGTFVEFDDRLGGASLR